MTQNPFATPEAPDAPHQGAAGGVLPPRTAVVPMLYLFAVVRLVEIPMAFMELGEELATMLIAYGAVTAVVFIVCAVCWSMWMYRATANAIALGGQYLLGEFTPRWAVGCHYVPIMNLWKPYQAIKAVHEASGGMQSQVLGAWWGMWIVGNMSARISDRVTESVVLSLVSTVAMIISAVLASKVITEINQLQLAKARTIASAA